MSRIRQSFLIYVSLLLKLRIYSQGNFVFDSANVQVGSLNINTKESEFGPFKIGDRLYYTSSRERRIGIINLDEATQHQMLDLYMGILKDSVTVTHNRPLRNKLNNSLNQGSAFYDKNSGRLYYAGNIPADGAGNYKLAIFSSELKNDKFRKPRVELVLPDNALVSHPMVYRNKLYFSSNMKGGKGKADLYSAELVDGKWTNIKNLEQLNSPYDDYFPYVVNGREIYFSSNRPGGFGGLDLYKFTKDSDSTGQVQNLGKPINSKADDYGVYMEPSQDKGYFTSNRNGNDDIFHFRKTWPTFNNCVDAIRESYCYDLTDEKSFETDSLRGYFYEWDFGDGTKQKGISVTHCYLDPGEYTINLNIVDVSTKAVFLNQTSLDLKVDSIVQLKVNALDTMLVNKKFTVNTLGTYLPGKKVTGYYFEIDGKRIRKPSFDYAFAKTGNYQIKLGIEYDDLELKTKGLMCTVLNVACVDMNTWLPYEDRKVKEIVDKIQVSNIRTQKTSLEELNFDAELAVNTKLGISKDKLAEKLDEYVNSESTRAMLEANASREQLPGRNLGNNKNGLNNMDEEAALTLKKKEQEQKDKDGFNGKNLGNDKDYLNGMDEEAALALKKKEQEQKDKDGFNGKNLGNDKDYLNGMDEEAALALKKKEQEQKDKDGFNGKNLGNDKDYLNGMDEEAALALKKKEQVQKDKDGFNGKNLGNDKDYLNGMDEEAALALKKKEQEQKDKAGFSGKNLGNDKDYLNGMDEEAALAIKKKEQEQKAKDGFNGRNLGNDKDYLAGMGEDAELSVKRKPAAGRLDAKNLDITIDTLLNLNEDVNVTFRVFLGKSKTPRDTSILHAKGLRGIKQELINDEYYYSVGSDEKVSSIEKVYKKVLKAGVKEPVVIAYRNNVIIPNQVMSLKHATFEEPVLEPKKQQEPLAEAKPEKHGLFRKRKRKDEPVAETKPVITDSTVTQSLVVNEKPAAKPDTLHKAPVKHEPKADSALVANTTKQSSTTGPAPVEESEEPQRGPVNSTPPPEKKPEKKETVIIPAALKPEDVKLEDVPQPEGELPAPKDNLAEFIEKYGDASATDLEFRVQISAFKYRNRYEFPHLAHLGKIENTLTEGGITRITIGGLFKTYRQAQAFNKKVVEAGQKDAFITAFYKGTRVYVENLEKMGILLTK